MPRSLRGRLVAAFIAVALTLLIAVGGTLFVVLRGLHQDSTSAGLGDVASSVIPQVRDAVGTGDLRGTILAVRDELAARDIKVMLIGSDGRLMPIGGSPVGDPIMTSDGIPGDTLRGAVVLDGDRYLYSATVIRRAAAVAPRAVAFLALDRSGALAVADLVRTLPAVAIVILLIAAPLAWLIARGVTRPLDRLAAAAAGLPSGGTAAVPVEGPSEVQALTGTFNAMADELAATRRRESELLANLRHDLRTPLTVISGYATALRDGTAKGANAAKAATAIEEESERLARLVEQIGAVERLRSGDDGPRPEPIDVHAVLAEAAGRFAAQAQAAGVTVVADPIADGDLSLAADRVALDRMLGNLLSNALAVVDHGGTIRLEAGATTLPRDRGATDPAVWLGVIDDGPGFPPGGAAKAFERFWRGDEARAGTGSGLGLAIVRELAMSHGGTVYAENVTPHGARVGVILPRVPATR
ncbi:MAG TPA: HAMP domain-containing sensor histidine kinase [Candidatus Limnocylindrales bacterium]|nr:HAMP domain-containing sensor histidine kinase [Candidatus Limnocylindrales bacterium]